MQGTTTEQMASIMAVASTSSSSLPTSQTTTGMAVKKVIKTDYIVSKKQRMTLTCEWFECTHVFEKMDDFLTHITEHLRTIVPEPVEEIGQEEHICKWRGCNHEIHGGFLELMRHVYFHGFHIKLKSVGMSMTLGKRLRSCSMNSDSRNMIPDLPERFHCGWKYCEAVSDNPYYFYQHVRGHAEEYPPGKKKNYNCRCWWEGCEYACAHKYKLMDHLRSHTQEKTVACPTCGSLFSSSTKYVDHLKRQDDLDVQSYQCSHCSKRFSTERLLRDHMRKHVNNYKCPFCEMTTPSPSSLRQHIKYRHSDERDFMCDHCGASFKTVRDRQRHIDTRHGDDSVFSCTHTACTFKTKHEFEINAHLRNKHNGDKEAKYMCDICKKKYTRGRTLTTHLMQNHNLRWPPGHKKFRYKIGGDGHFHLQTVRYESYELSQQLQSERQRKALAGLNVNMAKILKNKKDESESTMGTSVAVKHEVLATMLQKGKTPADDEYQEEVLDLSNKSKRVAHLKKDKSKDEYSYNLNMLGEVALIEHTKEKRKSGEHDCSEKSGKRDKKKGKRKNSKTLKLKAGSAGKKTNDQQLSNGDQQEENPPQTPIKGRKRKRKDDSPTKLLIKMRKGGNSSEDDEGYHDPIGGDSEGVLPQTLQFVTEDGQVIVVETDMPNAYNEDDVVDDISVNDKDVTEVEVTDDIGDNSPEGVVLNLQQTNDTESNNSDGNSPLLNVDSECSYYTVVAGDSETIIGLVNSQSGVYTPIPEGYILNMQSCDSSSSVGPYTIAPATPEAYGVGTSGEKSVNSSLEQDDDDGNNLDISVTRNDDGSQSDAEYENVEIGVAKVIEKDE